jgi:transposase
LVAASSLDGITAAMTVEGAMDRRAFNAFVDRILGPSLRPGQIVIWDNLGVHKRTAAQQVIAAAGWQLLWLPPYSPDFTPIEQAFSKLKASMRRIGGRTREALDAAITAAASRRIPAGNWSTRCATSCAPARRGGSCPRLAALADGLPLLSAVAAGRHVGAHQHRPAGRGPVRAGRHAQPSAAILDSQSVKTTEKGPPRWL